MIIAFVFSTSWSTNAGQWSHTGDFPGTGLPFIAEVEFNSDSAANNPLITINGVEQTGEFNTPVGTMDGDSAELFTVGNNTINNNWFGDIAEVVLYSSIPSADEQMTLRNHFAAKYGITLS